MNEADLAAELATFRRVHPECNDLPDDAVRRLLIFQTWALGYRFGKLYETSRAALPPSIRRHLPGLSQRRTL